MHYQASERYDGSNWISVSETGDIPCGVSADGSTLTLTVNFGGSSPYTWVLTQLCGSWFGTQGPTPSGGFNDVKVSLGVDGAFEALIFDEGGDTPKAHSNRGTYTCTSSTMHVQNTEVYDGSNWVPDSSTFDTPYSISGNTLTLYINSSTTWTFARQ
jgi:hypothetical protein